MSKKQSPKRATKPGPICPHDNPADTKCIMFRCACGNVWMSGKFFGSVPRDRAAVSVLGLFSTTPAK